LRLNGFNNLSILSTITTGDVVIVTSMMPTATPNEEVYTLNVSTSGNAAVYRSNTQTRTWLTHPLQYSDSVIYLNDITRVTDAVIQQVIAPSIDPLTATYNIGLTSNKNAICYVTVYNNTTSTLLNQSSFEIVIVNTAPILRISGQVAVGNSLTITSIEGNLLYINGEQIAYTECDLVLNTVSGLTRGANGTGQQQVIPKYSEVFGIIPNNRMSDVLYSQAWNPLPGIYNQVDGDPLQISDSQGANFLRMDRN
jgi:hypothetical protein